MSEAIYDKDIAPELLRLGRLCADNGMHLVAHVEYESGCGVYTASIDPSASFATKLVHLAAECDGNVEREQSYSRATGSHVGAGAAVDRVLWIEPEVRR